MPVSADDVLSALRGVIDPELGDDVVSLGMVRTVLVEPPGPSGPTEGEPAPRSGHVEVELALTTEGCPLKVQLRKDVDARVGALPGVTSVKTTFGVMDRAEKAKLMDRARAKAQEGAPATDIPSTCKVVAIASGKGGVGKSSVTANLAAGLALRGLTVGVLDADIWGFSIPRMLGIDEKLEVTGTADSWTMAPVELAIGPGRVKVVSMGFLAEDSEAIMWRGLMLNRALQHFVEDVSWGAMDYLLIDLPPGTGDIQMGLARMLPRSEVIIVTTPALAAQTVAGRAADMARKGHLRVAGVIENMSAFVCEHGTSYPLFGTGGGARLAAQVGVPLLGQVPMEPSVAAGGDAGRPVALGEGPAAAAFRELARVVAEEAVPVVEVTGCSAASILASF